MTLRRDDVATSPLVGYILTFAVTSALVATVIWTSSTALDRRHRAAAEIQLRDLATRTVNALEEAFHVTDANPNVDYEKRLPLPSDIRGFSYRIDVNATHVVVEAIPATADLRVQTVVHNPQDRSVDGTVVQRVAAIVDYDPDTGDITLRGGS